MNLLDALLYGVVEGVTEFLPISSTGHLILLDTLFGKVSTEFLKSFEIIIQLGAIFAVIFLYRKKITSSILVWKKIAIAFVPTGIIGLLFHGLVKMYLLGNASVVLFALFFGGLLLILLEKHIPDADDSLIAPEDIGYRSAIWIGIAQSIALIPGVSRSAATIIAGRILRVPRTVIVEFSFLLAIPTMVAATSLDLLKSYQLFNMADIGYLAVGFATAFCVALVSVKYLLRYVTDHTLAAFGVYRILLALLFWLVVL